MAGVSEIEWTDVTWNPVAGCTLASAGCTNCYAMRMAARLQAMGHEKYKGTTRKSGGRYVWTGRVNIDPASLSAPLEWRRSKRIFVNSMSDLFHEKVPDGFIEKVWEVMAECPQHHFQILTKRPDRMAAMMGRRQLPTLQNAWLGTSVENSGCRRSGRPPGKYRERHPLRFVRAPNRQSSGSRLAQSSLGDRGRQIGPAS